MRGGRLPAQAEFRGRGGREHGHQVAGQHRRQPVAGEAGVIWVQHGKSGKREIEKPTDKRVTPEFVSALGIGDRARGLPLI